MSQVTSGSPNSSTRHCTGGRAQSHLHEQDIPLLKLQVPFPSHSTTHLVYFHIKAVVFGLKFSNKVDATWRSTRFIPQLQIPSGTGKPGPPVDSPPDGEVDPRLSSSPYYEQKASLSHVFDQCTILLSCLLFS